MAWMGGGEGSEEAEEMEAGDKQECRGWVVSPRVICGSGDSVP